MLSRGIDIQNIDCVVNYDVPINERIFVHRAGRTARGLASGTVLSLVDKSEVTILVYYITEFIILFMISDVNECKVFLQ